MLKVYDFLSKKECNEALGIVHSLRSHWIPRMGKDIPFFTLGTASYLDAGDKGHVFYKSKAQETNPLLLEHFSPLYDRLKEVLEKATGKKVAFEKELALPGFHIFLHHELFVYPLASTHFDLQFLEMPWKYGNIDYAHPFSFTLPIELPAAGGGLNTWDIYYNDVKDLTKAELEKLQKKTELHYIPYEVGKIVVHEGYLLHQIAPAKKLREGDERVTLQGHGLICDDVLRLYW